MTRRKRLSPARRTLAARRRRCWPRSARFAQARPARAVAQPGDVRRLHRQHPHHRAVACRRLRGHGEAPAWFILNIALWLWFTVLFANFAEALAEGRSKAQAASLRGLKQTVMRQEARRPERRHAASTRVRADELRKGDVVLVEAGDYMPADGEVIEGAASVDESAITGESAPVIRESGGDFSVGDRRHARAVRLDRRARHGQPGRDLPRPHDRHGRRRQAPEDAERDRADHPAGRADAGVPVRDRDAAAVLALQRRGGQARHADHDHRADRAAGVPDSRPPSARCCRRSAWPA